MKGTAYENRMMNTELLAKKLPFQFEGCSEIFYAYSIYQACEMYDAWIERNLKENK